MAVFGTPFWRRKAEGESNAGGEEGMTCPVPLKKPFSKP